MTISSPDDGHALHQLGLVGGSELDQLPALVRPGLTAARRTANRAGRSKLSLAAQAGRACRRDAYTANAFMLDVADRRATRVPLSMDGHNLSLEAVEGAFGPNIDYAVLVNCSEFRPRSTLIRPADSCGCRALIDVWCARGVDRCYCAVQPPSITSSLPVTNVDSSDAR